MKKLITALFLSCLFSYQAFATPFYTGKGKVTTVQLGANGDIFVLTDADGSEAVTTTGCELVNSVTTQAYVVPKTHIAYSEYYIMLLSTMDSGDNIQLRIDQNNCVLGNYRSITLINRSKP